MVPYVYIYNVVMLKKGTCVKYVSTLKDCQLITIYLYDWKH